MNIALINPPQQPSLETFFEIGMRADGTRTKEDG